MRAITHLRLRGLVALDMALEWVLLSLMAVVVLWLGLDAARESKRLQDRLSRIELVRPEDVRLLD